MNKKIFFILMGLTVVVTVIIISSISYKTYFRKGHVATVLMHASVSDRHARSVSQNIHFEIATTTTLEKRGLSGRLVIPNNYAMLFVFAKSGLYGFWMKNMLIPIDIVWLSDNGAIISIEKSVQPNTYPHVFYPPKPARYVLEARAGFSSAHGWRTGSVVALPEYLDENRTK